MREPRVYLSPYPPSREARPEAKVLHDEDDGAKAIRRLGILRRLSSSGRPGSRLRGPPRRVEAALWGDGAEGRGNVRPPALEVDIAPRAGPAHGGIDRPPRASASAGREEQPIARRGCPWQGKSTFLAGRLQRVSTVWRTGGPSDAAHSSGPCRSCLNLRPRGPLVPTAVPTGVVRPAMLRAALRAERGVRRSAAPEPPRRCRRGGR